MVNAHRTYVKEWERKYITKQFQPTTAPVKCKMQPFNVIIVTHTICFYENSGISTVFLKDFRWEEFKIDQKFRASEGGISSFDYFGYTLKSMANIVAVRRDVFLDAVWSSEVLVHFSMFSLENLCAPLDAHNIVVYCFCILCGEKNITTNNSS